MGLHERKARQKSLLRQEILDAASELFVTEGFDNVSMRRIADKIEYSPTTIYLYFRDKAELLDQVCQETFSRLELLLSDIERKAQSPLERLRLGLAAYIRFGLENPHHYRATFLLPVPEHRLKDHPKPPDSPGMKAFDFLRRSIRECVASGVFRELDPELLSQTFWAGIHGVTSLLITHCQAFPWRDREELIGSMVDTLTTGAKA